MADKGGPPDPRRSFWVFASGKKGTGKSYACRLWWDSYPFDRVLIDPTHDVTADLRADGVELEQLDADALPVRLDPYDPEHPRTYVFCPDMGHKRPEDDIDDMDRVVGLCFGHGPILLWVDEVGALTPNANRTPPNTRRLLHHGRHDHISVLAACPRPIGVDGLFISQADLIYSFRMPNPRDRERVANEVGYDPADFAKANARLQGHEHTRYDTRTDELWLCPPLPRHRAGVNRYPADLTGPRGEQLGAEDQADDELSA